MAEIKWRIMDARLLPSFDRARVGKRDYVITWREDNVRDYQLTIPEEDYSPDRAKGLVANAVAAHAQIIGEEGSSGGS